MAAVSMRLSVLERIFRAPLTIAAHGARELLLEAKDVIASASPAVAETWRNPDV